MTIATRIVMAAMAFSLITACGGGDEGSGNARADSAVEAMGQFMTYQVKGQHGRSYEMLHPAHQDLFSRADWERCLNEQGTIGNISIDIGLEEAFEDTVSPPGVDNPVDVLALTVKMTVDTGLQSESLTDTFNVAEIDDQWRFFASPEVVDCVERQSG